MRSRPQDPDDVPDAITVSAVTGDGLEDTWDRLSSLDQWRRAQGWRERRRAEQSQKWLSFEIDEGLKARFRANADVNARMEALQAKVANGDLAPEAAAEELLSLFAN
jgi:LAO/AO transport system kinase